MSFGVRKHVIGGKVAGHTATSPSTTVRWCARKSAAWSLARSIGACVRPTTSRQ
jgi:hypothetical protein